MSRLSGSHSLLWLVVIGACACSSEPAQTSSAAGGLSSTGGAASGGTAPTGGATAAGGGSATGGAPAAGGLGGASGGSETGGAPASGGGVPTGGTPATGGESATGGSVATGGSSGGSGGTTTGGTAGSAGTTTGGAAGSAGAVSTGGTAAGGAAGSAGSTVVDCLGGEGGVPNAHFPFPQNVESPYCTYPTAYSNADVRDAYCRGKATVITAEGAGGYLRVRKPDSGTVIDSTVSEGIGYGMILAVYMNDQHLFDNLWEYAQLHLNSRGLMDWEIGPDGNVTASGSGAATDGDEDMAWALIMADRQWGGQGTLDDTYLNYATELINLIWTHEIDLSRGAMLRPGDQWGDVDVTNPSYFAPAYYRVFGQVTGQVDDWNQVIDSSYEIINRSLNAASGNVDNGLVPAWCDSGGTPVEAYSGAPLHFQNDSTRTPFRIAQDYCYFGEARAKDYLEKISSFYVGVGVANIVDGYELDGTPRPERAVDGAQAASFVGPAGVGAMNDLANQAFIDEAYAAVATLQLNAGTIYYQKCWTALSLLMMTGNFIDLTAL